jgi:nucleotide-binding universal stress UspA family protein
MVRRIVIAFDFSPQSARAVVYGIELAVQLGAEPVVLTVLDVGDLRVAMKAGLHGFTTNAEVRRAVKRWVAEEDQALLAPSPIPVRRIIRRGIPERAIVAAAVRVKADMIVMASSGMGRRLPIGSRTKEVLRTATVPVLVLSR